MTKDEDFRIQGKKVYVVPMSEGHISAAYIGWLNNPRVVQYSSQRFTRHDELTCRKYLASFYGTDNLFVAIHESETSRFIGTMSVYISPIHATADIGILVGEAELWGRGYGLDAWKAIMDFLYSSKNIRKITAGTVGSNQGMLRIMERSGMTHEGTRSRQMIFDGKEEDVLFYARFRQK